MKSYRYILVAFLAFGSGCTVTSSEKENKGDKKTYGLFEFDQELYDFDRKKRLLAPVPL